MIDIISLYLSGISNYFSNKICLLIELVTIKTFIKDQNFAWMYFMHYHIDIDIYLHTQFLADDGLNLTLSLTRQYSFWVELWHCDGNWWIVYWGGMPPVAAHLCCNVETMGGRLGLLQRILSISSMITFVSLGTNYRYVINIHVIG